MGLSGQTSFQHLKGCGQSRGAERNHSLIYSSLSNQSNNYAIADKIQDLKNAIMQLDLTCMYRHLTSKLQSAHYLQSQME
jgi:hypothetical protein